MSFDIDHLIIACWKKEIDLALGCSVTIGLSKRLQNHPETAAALREEERRLLSIRVYSTKNREIIAYFEEKLAKVKANEEEVRAVWKQFLKRQEEK